MAVNMLNLYWEIRNGWRQLHFSLILQGLVPVDILFQVYRKFWNFLGKVIDQLNPFTCNSKGLTNFCNFFLGRSLTN
jgi:hypothetical protein